MAVEHQLERVQVGTGDLPDVDAHVGRHARKVQGVVADLEVDAIRCDVRHFQHRGRAPEARELVGVAATQAADHVNAGVPVDAQQAAQIGALEELVELAVKPVVALRQCGAGQARNDIAGQERQRLVDRGLAIKGDQLAQAGVRVDALAELAREEPQQRAAAADLEGVLAEHAVQAQLAGVGPLLQNVDADVGTQQQVQARAVLQVRDVLQPAREATDALRHVQRRVGVARRLIGKRRISDDPSRGPVASDRGHLVGAGQLGVERRLDLIGRRVPGNGIGGHSAKHEAEIGRAQLADDLLHFLRW